MEPSYVPIGSNVRSQSEHVVLETRMPIVECPPGMVPILRNSRRGQMVVHNTGQVIQKDDQIGVSFLYLCLV
jgi:hypothetical protein